ncbi:MAG: tetratricopeptide repeat protein [Chloroflexi bacterium]|nr:tetratricopeptide repeat protein [Chloroflexota bacterium]MBU1748034.1 tetratricopeptide repeat protein [Chloroflexota bacterium]
MEEYAQFVDVELVTAWERMEYLLARLWQNRLMILAFLVFFVLWGLQYSETSAVVMFLVGSAALLFGVFPRARDVYAYRAWKHHLAGDPTSAVANYRQALAVALTRYPRITTDTGQATRRVDRFCTNILYSLGMQYVFLNRAAEARTAFENALVVRPNEPLLLTGLGSALLRQGQDQEAQETFDRVLKLVQEAPQNQNLLQRALSLSKVAFQRLFSIMFQRPVIDTSTIYTFIGDAYAGAGRYQQAFAAYERATALNPQSPNARHGLGRLHYELGHYDEATAAYRQVLANRRLPAENRAITSSNLGIALLFQGHLPEAQAAFEQAIALNRRSPFGYLGLARVYSEQGQYERALEYSQHALALAPSSVHPHIGLGGLYADQGRYEEAITQYEQAMSLEPSLGWAWLERARMETLRGDQEAALEYLAQALEHGPRHAIRRRALEEKKLRPLHDLPRFRELVGESEEEKPTTP